MYKGMKKWRNEGIFLHHYFSFFWVFLAEYCPRGCPYGYIMSRGPAIGPDRAERANYDIH
jgi:hypothetical protein